MGPIFRASWGTRPRLDLDSWSEGLDRVRRLPRLPPSSKTRPGALGATLEERGPHDRGTGGVSGRPVGVTPLDTSLGVTQEPADRLGTDVVARRDTHVLLRVAVPARVGRSTRSLTRRPTPPRGSRSLCRCLGTVRVGEEANGGVVFP